MGIRRSRNSTGGIAPERLGFEHVSLVFDTLDENEDILLSSKEAILRINAKNWINELNFERLLPEQVATWPVLQRRRTAKSSESKCAQFQEIWES